MSVCVILAVLSLHPWELGSEVCPGDLARFPYDRDSVEEFRAIAAEHYYWLRHNVPRDDPSLRVVDHNLACWTHLKWAWYYAESEWVTDERRADLIHCELEELYDLLGCDNYRAGLMPALRCRVMNPNR